jgi:hypothetical protein
LAVCDVDMLKQLVSLGGEIHEFNYELSIMDEHMEFFYRIQTHTRNYMDSGIEEENSKITKLEKRAQILKYLLSEKVYLTVFRFYNFS